MEHYTLLPGKGDVLGDRWASRISQLWDRMKAADAALTGKPWAYNIWQWAMCEMVGMTSRVVSSPQAIAIACSCNNDPTPDMDILEPLLSLSDSILGAD